MIDTDRFSRVLRQRAIDLERRQILMNDFRDTEQESDLTVPPNCGGFGRVRHFRQLTSEGWPNNPLPIVPACRALGIPCSDTMTAQVFQNSVCNWRCWYCYVPFSSLSGDLRRSAWATAPKLVELYLAENERPSIIDLSGGQPDITPEWIPWMMRALVDVGVHDSVYLWSDDNLSNDYFWRYLNDTDKETVRTYANYGRVCCFKGFDAESFAFNTKASPELFTRQFELMGKLIDFGLDIYAYATFTCQSRNSIRQNMSTFVDRLQELHHNLPLRLVPLEIQTFVPVEKRDFQWAQIGIECQLAAIDAWTNEIHKRYQAYELNKAITDVSLGRD